MLIQTTVNDSQGNIMVGQTKQLLWNIFSKRFGSVFTPTFFEEKDPYISDISEICGFVLEQVGWSDAAIVETLWHLEDKSILLEWKGLNFIQQLLILSSLLLLVFGCQEFSIKYKKELSKISKWQKVEKLDKVIGGKKRLFSSANFWIKNKHTKVTQEKNCEVQAW